ncbi:MAG: EamA family transporter [Alphaproteobacteria bacterium]|nr:EamA family transporter [Alphaproteobacteria bacterium]MBV9694163.1 EamA family transporter [Alphaproteobacteria bacterium]
MNWIALAFCGPLLWAVSTHIDKYLVEKYFEDSGVGALLIFTALIGLMALPVIAVFQDVMSLGLTGIAVTTASGLMYLTAMYFYLRALQREEASVIAPLFQTSTLFTYALAYFVLHEALTPTRIAGGLLIAASAVTVSYEPGRKHRFKPGVVIPLLACTATLAASSVVFKVFAIKDAFWPVTFWTFLGEALFGAAMMLSPGVRRDFFGMFAKSPGAVIGINTANELINLGGGLAARYASLIGPVALVQAIGGTTAFFVFLFGVLLSLFFPKLGREDLSRRGLIRKAAAAVLIVAGVILIGEQPSH